MYVCMYVLYLDISLTMCLHKTWQKMKALVYLVFRNSILSVLDEGSKQEGESIENGIITSVTHGVMTGICHTSRIF